VFDIGAIYANIAWGLLGVVTCIILLMLLLAFRNPVLYKIGLRNIPRRAGQSILIVVGLTLSTIIIVSSFATGDTLNVSVRRQAVAAYGNIDEIIAPPLLSMLATMGTGEESAESLATQEQLSGLFEGGLTSVLTILDGGLPGISTNRLAQLKEEAEAEPLIDGVAGSILFPTIIRNTSTGQGEPLGFIFAVDDDYDQTFGLTRIDGEALEIETLSPGVGNIFVRASELFGLVGDLGRSAGIELSISNVATFVAAAGTLLSGAESGDLANMSLDLATLDQLGIDTQPLSDNGIESINLGEMLASVPELQQFLAPAMTNSATITDTATPSDTAATSAGSLPGEASSADAPATAAPTTDASATDTPPAANLLTNVADSVTGLLSGFNLATMGSEMDRVLGEYGLQLKQGDLYLNRIGAENLDAQPGDVLELFIGPIPVPFRVRAIVEEASPLGAVFPVAVMRLDEAQKLLFMGGKVNNVLVSNEGDLLNGVEHTGAVSKRLSELAMDPDALATAVEILQRPQVMRVLESEADRGIAGLLEEEEDEIPPFVQGIITTFAPGIGEAATQMAEVPAALAASQGGEVTPEVRALLANMNIRTWLTSLDLPAADRAELASAFSALNQFDVLTPLSKETVLLASDIGGSIFTSLFSVFGFFSVIAGILLIFLIFVMLAAERRSEMGIARAIGVQRNHLVEMFASEGMVYSLAAATLGVVIGLFISWVMIEYLGSIINNVAGQVSGGTASILSVAFQVSPVSIAISWSMGLLITFIVVTWSSWRVSRLNIVAAIRDLPDETNAKRLSWWGRITRWIMPLLLLLLAWRFITWGMQFTLWTAVLIGATCALFGVLYIVGRVLEYTSMRQTTVDRLVYTVIGLGLLGLWVTPWPRVLPAWGLNDYASDPTQLLAVFAFGGPLIITGAIMAIMFNADFFTWLIDKIFGGISSLTPILKTAIAYPLSTRFRTGMAMVLFAMIMATVIIMAMVIQATQSLIVLSPEQSGGFEIQASDTLLSFFDPITDLEAKIEQARGDYPGLDQIAHVGSVVTRYWLNAIPLDPASGEGWTPFVGLNDGYIEQAATIYPFAMRAEGYADDAAVWEALRTHDDVVVVRDTVLDRPVEATTAASPMFATLEAQMDEAEAMEAGAAPSEGITATAGVVGVPAGVTVEFDRRGGGFSLHGIDANTSTLPEVWIDLEHQEYDNTTMEERRATRRVQVIGVLAEGTMQQNAAIQGNVRLLNTLVGETLRPDATYVKVAEGADAQEVARELERAFLGNGLDATIMADSFAQGRDFTRNILRLLQGFMALGLLVGIAGLGVITTRTVVERRQQVGMLRSIGYQARMVALSFLLESSFIAITGIVIGAVTGIVLGMSMVNLMFTNIADFQMPWGSIIGIMVLAWVASLLTTIIPAWQASRIYPAEALRYE